MKVTIVHDFVKKNNKTMLLLSFCNFFFSFGWNKKKLSLMKNKKPTKKVLTTQNQNRWRCLTMKMSKEQLTLSVSLWLTVHPPWHPPTHPECCFTPTLHRPTPTVKDQTACLATPHLPPKPSQTLVDVLWQGTNWPDQWIFCSPPTSTLSDRPLPNTNADRSVRSVSR